MFVMMSVALGAELVVHDGAPEAVRARAEADLGAPVELVTLPELLDGHPPALVGVGRLSPCTGARTDRATVQVRVDAAEKAAANGEIVTMRLEFDAARAALGCLSEPVDPVLAARVHQVLGVVAFAEGRPDDASAAFRQARLFAADLAWDGMFGEDGRELFDAAGDAVAKAPRIVLELVPPLAKGEVLVDGRPAEVHEGRVALGAGEHLVQVVGSVTDTLAVDLTGSPGARLVLPGAVSAEMVGWAADPTRSDALAALLAVAVEEGRAVHVVADDTVWQVPGFVALEAKGPSLKPLPPPLPPPKRSFGLPIAGAAVAVVAGGASIGTYAAANGMRNDRFADETAHGDAKRTYDTLRAVTYGLYGLAAGGAGVAGLGLALPVGDSPGGLSVRIVY